MHWSRFAWSLFSCILVSFHMVSFQMSLSSGSLFIYWALCWSLFTYWSHFVWGLCLYGLFPHESLCRVSLYLQNTRWVFFHMLISFHTQETFHWKCHTFKIHRFEKLKFRGKNQNLTKISIWICTARYRKNPSVSYWWISKVHFQWKLSFEFCLEVCRFLCIWDVFSYIESPRLDTFRIYRSHLMWGLFSSALVSWRQGSLRIFSSIEEGIRCFLKSRVGLLTD